MLNIETLVNSARDWLGIDAAYQIQKVYFRSLLPAILLPILIGVGVAFTWFQYHRERMLSVWRRVCLAFLRAVAYTVLLVILFQPAVGLTKSTSIHRTVGLLVDGTGSMGHKDPRINPRDLADAAQALGKARYVLPEFQESIARARGAMVLALNNLKPSTVADALAAQRAAEAALVKALDDKTFKGDSGPMLPGVAKAATDVKALLARQKGLTQGVEKTQQAGGSGAEAEYMAHAKGQQMALAELDTVTASLRKIVPALAPGTEGQFARVTRIDMAKGMIGNQELGVLQRIAAQFRMPTYIFGQKLEPVGGDPEKPLEGLLKINANAPVTRLGEAIEAFIGRLSGQSIAGLILITDGNNNEGKDPLEAARQLGKRGIPLFIFGLGLEKPKDVKLQSLIVPAAAFPKDKITARVQVVSSGYDNVAGDLRVVFDGNEVARLSVPLKEQPQFVEVPIEIPKDKKGEAKLELSINEQPGEDNVANNKVTSTIKIFDQKIKVLYIEGKPRWEFRYLKVVLQRDTRLDVKFWMTEGDEELPKVSPIYVNGFPTDPKAANEIDLIILGDVPAWKIQDQMPRMVELVKEKGASLLMLAGERYSPFSYAGTALGDMLPVAMSTPADHVEVGPQVYPVATGYGKRSFAMLESSEEANDAVWSLVRPLSRVPKLDGAKSAAKVIVELPMMTPKSEQYPLVAWHYAGRGKVMYVGTDQMWRLRFMRGDFYHAKFWGQALPFLALSRLLGENKPIQLEAEAERPKEGTLIKMRVGEKLQIAANVQDEFYRPVTDKQFTVYLERTGADTRPAGAAGAAPKGRPVTLTAVQGAPGLFEGFATPEFEGRYQVCVEPAKSKLANVIDLMVEASDLEQRETSMQETLLRNMAAESGGRFLTVSEWPALAGMLEGKPLSVTEHKDVELWDHWPLFAAFLVCVGAEWFLRRRFHLI